MRLGRWPSVLLVSIGLLVPIAFWWRYAGPLGSTASSPDIEFLLDDASLSPEIEFLLADGGCGLHPDLQARIRKDLAPWRSKGISVQDMRKVPRFCDECMADTPGNKACHPCSNAYLRVTIDNGTLYMNSLLPRNPGESGGSSIQPPPPLTLYMNSLLPAPQPG